jgi:hypothetical protein
LWGRLDYCHCCCCAFGNSQRNTLVFLRSVSHCGTFDNVAIHGCYLLAMYLLCNASSRGPTADLNRMSPMKWEQQWHSCEQCYMLFLPSGTCFILCTKPGHPVGASASVVGKSTLCPSSIHTSNKHCGLCRLSCVQRRCSSSQPGHVSWTFVAPGGSAYWVLGAVGGPMCCHQADHHTSVTAFLCCRHRQPRGPTRVARALCPMAILRMNTPGSLGLRWKGWTPWC